MRKKDIIRALQQVDEDTAVKLSEKYHGIAEQDHERLLQKIEQRLQDAPEQITPEPVQPARSNWVLKYGAAAACLAVCCGTFGGLVWLRMHGPAQQLPETSGAPVPVAVHETAHSLGERYAASNLTAEGALYVTVTDAVQEDGRCHVTLTLESEDAVSIAGAVTGDATVFLLDNFRAAVEQGGTVQYVSPCEGRCDAPGGQPYTCSLKPGERCTVELWYAFSENPQTWRLITGTDENLPCTEIITEG